LLEGVNAGAAAGTPEIIQTCTDVWWV
jgi:hypothetical protein